MTNRPSLSGAPGTGGDSQGQAPWLSIVIPARDEQGKIGLDVRAASEFLHGHGLSGEILVVDDGSRDATAQEARQASTAPGVASRVLALEAASGKGAALRAGVAVSGGAFVLLADSGGCIPYSCALDAIELIRSGACDIAHGSRRLPSTRVVTRASPLRRVGSRLFMGLIHRLAGIGGCFSDTQCGFKVYPGALLRRLCAASVARGFMLDIELILRARREGLRIREFPVRWTCDRDSRLRPFPAALACLLELRRILRALREDA